MARKLKAQLRGALRSLTMWFNTTLLVLLPIFEYAEQVYPQLQAYVGPELYKTMGLVVVVGNILLRFRTYQALQDKGGHRGEDT